MVKPLTLLDPKSTAEESTQVMVLLLMPPEVAWSVSETVAPEAPVIDKLSDEIANETVVPEIIAFELS